MNPIKHQIGTSKKNIVWVKDIDLEILKMLHEYRSLALYQIEYYLEQAYGIKRNTIRKKLLRWKKKKIVCSKIYTKLPTAMVYYRLDDEGIKLLKEYTIIPQNETIYSENSTNRKNTDHYFGVRDIVLKTKLLLGNLGDGLYSGSPEQFSPFVFPDWIMKFKNRTLCLELDIGTESIGIIRDKISKYHQYATRRPDENVYVLFAVIDDVDPNLKFKDFYAKDRSKRIINLKDAIIDSNVLDCSNLHVYVVSLNRVAVVAKKILTGTYPYDNLERHKLSVVSMKLLEMNDKDSYQKEELNADDFYLAEVNESLYADGHFSIRKNMEQKTVAIKVMEEGNVRDLDRLRYLALLRQEKRFKKSVDLILGVYADTDELKNDILGKPLEKTNLISTEMWMDFGEIPSMFQMVNSSRLEEVAIHES